MGSTAEVETLVAGVPPALRSLLQTLERADHAAYLVGGCIRDALLGRPTLDFDVTTSATPEQVMALFPRAVPIGIRHGTVMVPKAPGPVDVTTFRAGPGLEDDLALRDFRINAIALHLASQRLIDPFAGRTDLAAGALRCVGRARQRLAEDPLRAVRAARLAASHGLTPDAELREAMTALRGRVDKVAGERLQRELSRLLLADAPAPGLELLAETGIDQTLLPDASPALVPYLAALPRSLPLRLAAWLHGARQPRRLGRLRFPRRVQREVELLLRWHPIDRRADPDRLVSVRRLLQQLGDARAEALCSLREVELTAAGQSAGDDSALGRLRTALSRVRAAGEQLRGREDLALDGEQVMALLGCGPGPRVGEALQFLNECVLEEPACNEPEALRAKLRAWPGYTATGGVG